MLRTRFGLTAARWDAAERGVMEGGTKKILIDAYRRIRADLATLSGRRSPDFLSKTKRRHPADTAPRASTKTVEDRELLVRPL